MRGETEFVQVTRKFIQGWMTLASRPVTMKVWLWLVGAADRTNRVHTRDSAVMMSCGISRSSLFTAYAELEEARFIERQPGTIYLNAMLVWRGKRGAINMAPLLVKPEIDSPKPRRRHKPEPVEKCA